MVVCFIVYVFFWEGFGIGGEVVVEDDYVCLYVVD